MRLEGLSARCISTAELFCLLIEVLLKNKVERNTASACNQNFFEIPFIRIANQRVLYKRRCSMPSSTLQKSSCSLLITWENIHISWLLGHNNVLLPKNSTHVQNVVTNIILQICSKVNRYISKFT